MLNFLPAPLLGCLSVFLMVANTLFWVTFLFPTAILKLIMPLPAVRRATSAIAIRIAENWVGVNRKIFDLVQRTDWRIQGDERLRYGGWYLVIANHQSWVDIFVLQYIFHRQIPFLKFFIKQELFWFPVMGLAWWALDFPFMKRYSKAYLKRHPEMRGKDLETTRQACEKFKDNPTSVINFVEGTRLTSARHKRQNSPYQRLLKPKAGGIALVLGAMGHMLNSIVDVTICYPHGSPTFWGFLCGQVPEIEVIVQERQIPPHFIGRDYTQDDAFRQEIQAWTRDLWQKKDELLQTWPGLSESGGKREA
jgi:1-acyl-sn-glycerol-3-phosphate acyltransferase